MEKRTDPWVAQSPRRIAKVVARANRDVRDRAERRFNADVIAWARRDDGPIPSRAQAEANVRAELEVLCRALGRWAALAPEEIFPSPTRDWW